MHIKHHWIVQIDPLIHFQPLEHQYHPVFFSFSSSISGYAVCRYARDTFTNIFSFFMQFPLPSFPIILGNLNRQNYTHFWEYFKSFPKFFLLCILLFLVNLIRNINITPFNNPPAYIIFKQVFICCSIYIYDGSQNVSNMRHRISSSVISCLNFEVFKRNL